MQRWLSTKALLTFHSKASEPMDKAQLPHLLNPATWGDLSFRNRMWTGWTHFLKRGLRNFGTEMSLPLLAYKLKRVINPLGMTRTMKAMKLVSA
jgi:hypothetical protein